MRLATILVGDVRERLRELPDNSVQCVVTSPPYFGLRDYGTAQWDGGDPSCDHTPSREVRTARPRSGLTGSLEYVAAQEPTFRNVCGKCGALRIDNQIGLEPTPADFVAALVDVFREVRRVLRDDGTCWVNLGDSYAGPRPAGGGTMAGFNDRYFGRETSGDKQRIVDESKPARPAVAGLKPKDLIGIPWRVAFALQEDGWVLRSDIVWSKKNPMPESVTDRPTKSHEYIFMFSKGKWVGDPVGRFAHISEQDARWLALFLDTEGNITVKRATRPTGNLWYGAQIAFAGTSRRLLEQAQAIVGQGNIIERGGTNAPMYYYQISNQAASDLLRRVYPYLIVKQRQARINIFLQTILSPGGKKRPGGFRDVAHSEMLERLWEANKACNHFGDPDLSWVPEPKFGKWTSQPYFYDADAIREDAAWDRWGDQSTTKRNPGTVSWMPDKSKDELSERNSRNKRTVWTVATQPYSEAHFATFPEKLIEPCILAGTSERGACASCGAPWRRVVERSSPYRNEAYQQVDPVPKYMAGGGVRNDYATKKTGLRKPGWRQFPDASSQTLGWEPSCRCGDERTVPCVVLDPFSGSGTTGVVALRHNRQYIGVELNPDYAEMSRQRITRDAPLFNQVEIAHPSPAIEGVAS